MSVAAFSMICNDVYFTIFCGQKPKSCNCYLKISSYCFFCFLKVVLKDTISIHDRYNRSPVTCGVCVWYSYFLSNHLSSWLPLPLYKCVCELYNSVALSLSKQIHMISIQIWSYLVWFSTPIWMEITDFWCFAFDNFKSSQVLNTCYVRIL